jgi:hypothetical protein
MGRSAKESVSQSGIRLLDRPTCNEPPLDTYKFAIQGNKRILTIC